MSGCSSKSFNGINLGAFMPTPVPKQRATPTPNPQSQAPSVAGSGYDAFAGNCPDAANEDANLITYAQSQNYNFDMQLAIKPTIGCNADSRSAAYKTFIRQVSKAELTLNALDTNWIYGNVSTRDLFLQSIFTKLQQHYPSLSDVTITVSYNAQPRATLSYTGHGAPQIQDLYAQ
jgi:hypothetical protein